MTLDEVKQGIAAFKTLATLGGGDQEVPMKLNDVVGLLEVALTAASVLQAIHADPAFASLTDANRNAVYKAVKATGE